MDFLRSLTFYFQDGRWFRKVLVAAVCLCVPPAGWILAAGWALEICRRAIRREADAVPSIQFRRDWAGGAAVAGAVLVFGLPSALWIGLGATGAAVIWRGGGTGEAAFAAYWWIVELLAAGLLLAGALGAAAAIGRLADGERFCPAVRFTGAVARVRSAPGAYLAAILAGFPLALLALSGFLVCGAGTAFTMVYALGAEFHLLGQARASAAERAACGSIPGRR
ncbi:MAG: DUF4013 domain-containing protein [Anaerolineales bacterium]|nr:DUF4013 domain-containing protein [Anaerolineales bacterium]